MQTLVLMLAAGSCTLAGASADEWPAPFQELAEVSDEEAFVERFREIEDELLSDLEDYGNEAVTLNMQGKADAAQEKVEQARAAAQQIRDAYETALDHYPQNARLHNYYGELLYDIYGEHAGALMQWNKALSYDSDLALAHNNLALHYFHTGQYRLGLDHLDRALELDPRNPDFNFNAAQFYLIHKPQIAELRGWRPTKVYKKAMEHSRKAIEGKPDDYELLRDYALNYFAAENFGISVEWDKVAEAWQAAREHAPNDTERFSTWLYEGRAWIRAGEEDKAIAALEKALELQPDSNAAQRLLDDLRDGDEPPVDTKPVAV